MKNIFSALIKTVFKLFISFLLLFTFGGIFAQFIDAEWAVLFSFVPILIFWNFNLIKKELFKNKKESTSDIISEPIKTEEIDLNIEDESHPEYERIKALFEKLKPNIYRFENIVVDDSATGELLKKYAGSIDEKIDLQYRVFQEATFFVAGLKYHDYTNKKFKYILSTLDLPYKVSLIPEPENEFDSSAIQVKVKSYMLGYVPRYSGHPYYIENRDVLDSISQGNNVEAFIVEYDESEVLEERVKLTIKY